MPAFHVVRPRALCVRLLQALSLSVALGAATTVLAAPPPSGADTGTHAFHISAGPLAEALRQFVAQSGLQVLYDPAIVEGHTSARIDSASTPRAALDALLRNTGLVYEFTDSGTVVIKRAPPAAKPQSTQAQKRNVAKEAASPIVLQAVTVTGTRLTSAESEQAQEKIILNRQAIDASGASTIAALLSTLPEFSLQSTTSPFQGGRGASFSYLRGLPKDFTLTLINGRRIGYGADVGQGAFNLSLLPLAAVDHIEILPTGSAAVYGGSALAGVINLILKDHLDGGQIDLNHGGADDYEDSGANITWGKRWNRLSLLIGGTYRSNTALKAYQRAITSDLNYSRFGGRDISFPYTDPGNVYSLNGQPLPGLKSTTAGIPAGQDGTHLTIDDFKSTDGIPNSSPQFFGITSLIPKSEQYSGFLNASFRINNHFELFTEWLYSHTTGEEVDYPKYAINPYGTVVVPADNPYNPFGAAVGVDYLFQGTTSCYCLTTHYTRGLVGARGEFGDTPWSWEIAVSGTRNDEKDVQSGVIDNAKINAALAKTDPSSALNLFGDRSWTDKELAPYVTNTPQSFRTTLQYVNGFVRGPLFDLGAGPWEAVFGLEYERDSMDYGADVFFHGTYDNKAAFAELSAPLIASRSGNSGAGAMLALTGAVRYDNYSSFGGRISPAVGLQLRPISSLLFRANYSTAYKPPTLLQLGYPQTSYERPLSDPRRGGEAYTATTYFGGNPKLDALTGDAKTYGFVYSPDSASGFELSITGFQIHTKNYPQQINYHSLVNMESLFPGAIVRAEPTSEDVVKGYAGVITTIFDSYLNFGTFDVAGADLGLSWRIETERHGSFKPSFAATYMREYKYQLAPGVVPTETVNQANLTGWAPKWKGNVSLAWQNGPVQVAVVGHWVSAYRDYDDFNPATPIRKLGDFWMFDANVRYNVGKIIASDSAWLSNAYLTVGGVNIFNRLPPYSYYQGNIGYDPTQYDIRGRYIYAQFGTRF